MLNWPFVQQPVNTNGSGFASVHNFNSTDPNDGSTPYAGLILSGNTLYGTTYQGGRYAYGYASDYGTVFAVNTDGTGYTNLYGFNAIPPDYYPAPYTNSGGAYPAAGLILAGNALYGTASDGGNFGNGTVFIIGLVPSLGITPAVNQVVLSWPTWAPNFSLQTTTNLVPPVVWNAVSPAPVVVNGLNVVTNAMSGIQQFYRLSQ